MNRQEEFERLLAGVADAHVGSAGGGIRRAGPARTTPRRIKADLSSLEEGIGDEEVFEEIRRARQRQRDDPSLLSGDPSGFFTYEDPVLAIMAYLYQAHLLMSSVVGAAGDRGEQLRNESFWKWAETGVRMWLSRHDKSYQTLMGMTPRRPLKLEGDIVRIAVAGDAGFKGLAQLNVIEMIKERHRAAPFDLFIHLGDIYFAGQSKEFYENFLAPFKKAGPKMLTLIGNHDLYFGADAFIDLLRVLEQPGRYFSVESPHWRVACLDTALPAETLRRNSGLLDEGQLDWLDEQLDASDGKKTVLMSHHYTVSGWEKSSEGLKQQLAPRLKKIFAWYWGHEHRCATYSRRAAGVYGACVGNGAFLEKWKPPSLDPSPNWYARGRCSCYQEQSAYWPHGYLELELHPTKLVENYHLEGGGSHTRILKRT